MVGRVYLAWVVWRAEDQFQVGQVDLVVDNPVEQAFFVEEVPVTVVVGNRLATPQAPRHGSEFSGIAFGLTGSAPTPCLMSGMVGVFSALTVGGPAVAGHVFILAPESTRRVDPAGHGLDAGGFRGFVHHDFFFRHDFSKAAI
ncbi:hypothetical protein D9M71_698270 [compost metagenome]